MQKPYSPTSSPGRQLPLEHGFSPMPRGQLHRPPLSISRSSTQERSIPGHAFGHGGLPSTEHGLQTPSMHRRTLMSPSQLSSNGTLSGGTTGQHGSPGRPQSFAFGSRIANPVGARSRATRTIAAACILRHDILLLFPRCSSTWNWA